jgi:hypothetical protein
MRLLVSRVVGISDDDMQVRNVKGEIIVAAVPHDHIGFLLGLAKNTLVIDAGID